MPAPPTRDKGSQVSFALTEVVLPEANRTAPDNNPKNCLRKVTIKHQKETGITAHNLKRQRYKWELSYWRLISIIIGVLEF